MILIFFPALTGRNVSQIKLRFKDPPELVEGSQDGSSVLSEEPLNKPRSLQKPSSHPGGETFDLRRGGVPQRERRLGPGGNQFGLSMVEQRLTRNTSGAP